MTRNLSRELSPSDTDETALVELRLPSKADKVEFAKKINPKSEMVWISHTQSLRMPYIPQVNDQVYYVPRAHEKYCEVGCPREKNPRFFSTFYKAFIRPLARFKSNFDDLIQDEIQGKK